MTFGMLQGGGGNVRWDGTGFIGPDGSYISSPAAYTWAQFTAGNFDLTTARFVWVSDRHSTRDSSATPGSLWRIDPTASTTSRKRQLVSDPLYFASAAAAPDPTAYPGLRIYNAGFGLGGSDWVSNGTVYRPELFTIQCINVQTQITITTNLTTEYQFSPFTIPRDVNNKSLMQPGDYLHVVRAVYGKTGTTDTLTRNWRFGTLNTASDTLITTVGATTAYRYDENMLQQRLSDSGGFSRIKSIGVNTGVPATGGSATGPGAAVNVTLMDGSSDSYWNTGVLLSGTTDTDKYLVSYVLNFCRGAA